MAQPSELTITKVEGTAEPDRLIATGTLPADPEKELQGFGWFSAITNYYPPEAYLPDGNRKEGSQPQTMTQAQQTAYYQDLIAQTNPELFPALAAVPRGVFIPAPPKGKNAR